MSTFFQFFTAIAALIGVLLLIKKRLEETMLPIKTIDMRDDPINGFIRIMVHVYPRSIPTTIYEITTPDGILAYSVFGQQNSFGEIIEKPDLHSASPSLPLDKSILPLSVDSAGHKLFFFFKPSDSNASRARIVLKTAETWASKRHTIQIKYTMKNE